MSGANTSSLQVAPEDLDRVEELARYLAAHDGRMPTEELPLAWWLVDVLDRDEDDPVRRALAGIPVRQLDRSLSPKKAHAWNTWFARYDQLSWVGHRGQDLDEVLGKDKTLRDWYNDMLSRHHVGSLGRIETLLLGRNPLWDPERLPNTKDSRGQMAFKIGIRAVREFYLEHQHTDIPEGYTAAGLDVCTWWRVQRNHYRNNGLKEHLRQQMARLGTLGADLRTDKERAAADPVFANRDRLKEIADFVGAHGMEALPRHGEPFINSARTWLIQYSNGTLDPALEAALEAIDGWSWMEGTDLKPFREFAFTHGHLDVAREYVTSAGEPIGSELYRIRKERWTAVDPDASVKRVDAQLDALAQRGWEQSLLELGVWNNLCAGLPESDYVTPSGFHLGAFVKWALRKAEHGLLPRARLRDLSRVTENAWWLEADEEAYAATEAVLSRFARQHGHCSPFWGETWGEGDAKRDLALFVLRACADWKAGDFSPLDPHRLESLPGWSWSRRERARQRRKATRASSAEGRSRQDRTREPVRSVRTDIADPDSTLNRSGLKQFLPGD